MGRNSEIILETPSHGRFRSRRRSTTSNANSESFNSHTTANSVKSSGSSSSRRRIRFLSRNKNDASGTEAEKEQLTHQRQVSNHGRQRNLRSQETQEEHHDLPDILEMATASDGGRGAAAAAVDSESERDTACSGAPLLATSKGRAQKKVRRFKITVKELKGKEDGGDIDPGNQLSVKGPDSNFRRVRESCTSDIVVEFREEEEEEDADGGVDDAFEEDNSGKGIVDAAGAMICDSPKSTSKRRGIRKAASIGGVGAVDGRAGGGGCRKSSGPISSQRRSLLRSISWKPNTETGEHFLQVFFRSFHRIDKKMKRRRMGGKKFPRPWILKFISRGRLCVILKGNLKRI